MDFTAKKICMFVYNDCTHDARVLKEAKTLTDAGFNVRIIALEGSNLPKIEQRDGFIIERVGKGTHLSLEILKFCSKIFRLGIDLRTKNIIENSNPKLYQRILFALISLPGFFVYKAMRSTYLIWRKLMAVLTSFAPFLNFFTGFYWSAFSAAKKNKADIYHAHDLNTLPAGWLAKKRLGGKLIYDSHELYVERNTIQKPSEFAKKSTAMLEKFLLKSVDETITVNQSIAEELKNRYAIKMPAIVMNTPAYNIIEKPKSLRLELNIPLDKRIIIYSGSMTFNRGLEELIQSLIYLPEYVLILMGYGNESYLGELKNTAKSAGVQNRLYFFGPVPHEEVATYLASADVGAAPIKNAALSYYLCSPNKLFEFIQAGIPVVGSNFPELTRVITEQKIGYTFNPKDPEDIAQTIQKIFADSNTYQLMKNNTKEAAKLYNWEIESQKLIEVYGNMGFEIKTRSTLDTTKQLQKVS